MAVLKSLKFLVGLALLPFCVAISRTLWRLLLTVQPGSLQQVPRTTWGLAIGFGIWIFAFFCMSRPIRTYVFGHELTHAIWAWAMGARVARFKVSQRGGSVALDRSNFLIALAPYFFPIYTIGVMLLYGALALFLDLQAYAPFWMGMVGLTWAFHLTFTVSMLLQHQPDIVENGRLFSYTVIYLCNALGICCWIVGVGAPTLEMLITDLNHDITAVWAAYFAGLQWMAKKLQGWLA